MRALFDEAEAAFKAAAHAFSIPKTDRGSDRARLAGLALAFQANHCISQCNNDEAVVLAGHALEFLDEKHEPRETAFATLTWGVALVWSGKEQQGFDACKSAIQLYRTQTIVAAPQGHSMCSEWNAVIGRGPTRLKLTIAKALQSNKPWATKPSLCPIA